MDFTKWYVLFTARMKCAKNDTCHSASPIQVFMSVATLPDCEQLCITNETCRSVDYNGDTQQCELNDVADEHAMLMPDCPIAGFVWSKKIHFGRYLTTLSYAWNTLCCTQTTNAPDTVTTCHARAQCHASSTVLIIIQVHFPLPLYNNVKNSVSCFTHANQQITITPRRRAIWSRKPS